MKLWTQTITLDQLREAAREVELDHPGCWLQVVGEEYYTSGGRAYHDPVLYEGPRSRWFTKLQLRSGRGNLVGPPCWSCTGRHARRKTEDCDKCDRTGISRDEGLAKASWCEHGWFMTKVFDLDPDARIKIAFGPDYRGREEFHRITGQRFKDPRTPREAQVLRALRDTARDPRMRGGFAFSN